jgi:NADH:ubiquinone oxidoreductase subunit 3 (subunit A)
MQEFIIIEYYKKMSEYKRIYIMFVMCVLLAFLILGFSFVIKNRNYNLEKISSYECGFQPFEDTRSRFDVKFYLVAILFIIFDIEIIYLLPWALSLDELGQEGVMSMIIFLFVLTVGFIYEWKKGALDWY